MQGKKLPKTSQDLAPRQHIKTNHDHSDVDDKTRIIQKNLVFANGIPTELHQKQILKQNIYFGRYGNINKITINSTQGNRKSVNCHAYVTYQSQLQASLAIVALDDFNLAEKPLKVSYGTTKYCSSFIKGFECKNPECFYLHKQNKELEVQNDDSKNVFKKQNENAFSIVLKNLDYVVERMLNDIEHKKGFPTLFQVVEFLIQSQFVTKNQIQSIKKSFQIPSQLLSIESTPPLTKKRSKSPEQQKLTKSNSFSTICTPPKPSIPQKKKIVTEQKNKKIEKKMDQKIKKKTFNLEQNIEKMIIRKVFQKKQTSFLSFVEVSENDELQHQKMKQIIEQHLLARK